MIAGPRPAGAAGGRPGRLPLPRGESRSLRPRPLSPPLPGWVVEAADPPLLSPILYWWPEEGWLGRVRRRSPAPQPEPHFSHVVSYPGRLATAAFAGAFSSLLDEVSYGFRWVSLVPLGGAGASGTALLCESQSARLRAGCALIHRKRLFVIMRMVCQIRLTTAGHRRLPGQPRFLPGFFGIFLPPPRCGLTSPVRILKLKCLPHNWATNGENLLIHQ